MNSAQLAKSKRLQRVLSVLSDREPHTTMELIIRANVCAVNSIVSELRDNGLDIRCQRQGDRWSYQWVPRA